LHGEMKSKVPKYTTPLMLGVGDKSAPATRKKKQAGVLSGSDGSGRGGESVGEMMRRRRLPLHAVESSSDFDIGVFKRLLTVVEQALDAGRVLHIMGEPVPKMMCDLSQIREVCVCPNTKTAKKALSVCNGLSEVRKNVVNRVIAIRLGENVVEKRPADDKEDHDTRVVAGTDTVDDKLRIRECTTTCERTRMFRVHGIAGLVEKQRILELQFKQDLQHDKACSSSPQSVKDGRADTNRIDKWCKVWAKQRMPRATRAHATAPLSAATIALLQSSGAALRFLCALSCSNPGMSRFSVPCPVATPSPTCRDRSCRDKTASHPTHHTTHHTYLRLIWHTLFFILFLTAVIPQASGVPVTPPKRSAPATMVVASRRKCHSSGGSVCCIICA